MIQYWYNYPAIPKGILVDFEIYGYQPAIPKGILVDFEIYGYQKESPHIG